MMVMFRVCSGYPEQKNTVNYSLVPGVPGVPGNARPHACAFFLHARALHSLRALVGGNTRNTRNKPLTARVSSVPGTRNRKSIPGTSP